MVVYDFLLLLYNMAKNIRGFVQLEIEQKLEPKLNL